MVQLTSILTLTTLLLLTSAQQDHKRPASGFQKVPAKPAPAPEEAPPVLQPRDLLTARQTCSGTCAECFGSGYILCPSSASICYKPGDPEYGLDSCTGSSSGSGSGSGSSASAAATPTSTGSAGDSDYCSGKLATCVSCFGEGYLACGDGVNCYNPADPRYDTCPDGTTPSGSPSSGGSGGSSTTTDSCEARHGAGNVPCGDDGCYNPGDGEVCCQDGYYCDKGETCSSTVGKCCVAGSTSSGCLGSGSGSSGGLSSLTSSLRTSSTRTSTGTATSTPTSFSNSGTSGGSSGGSVSEASSNLDVAVSKVAAVVLGSFGLFMLAL